VREYFSGAYVTATVVQLGIGRAPVDFLDARVSTESGSRLVIHGFPRLNDSMVSTPPKSDQPTQGQPDHADNGVSHHNHNREARQHARPRLYVTAQNSGWGA
jgi:hypothetical protein